MMSLTLSNHKKAALLMCLLIVNMSMSQTIDWYSMDSGGGVSEAGAVQVTGVIGQVDTVQMVSEDTVISGGFLPMPGWNDVVFKDSFD